MRPRGSIHSVQCEAAHFALQEFCIQGHVGTKGIRAYAAISPQAGKRSWESGARESGDTYPIRGQLKPCVTRGDPYQPGFLSSIPCCKQSLIEADNPISHDRAHVGQDLKPGFRIDASELLQEVTAKPHLRLKHARCVPAYASGSEQLHCHLHRQRLWHHFQ